MKRFYLLTILFTVFLSGTWLRAQENTKQWSLRSCLDYALANNIQLKKSNVALLSGEEEYRQAKAQLFPSLSVSATQGLVHYPSDEVLKNSSYSGNYSANANWKLFDGNRRSNTIKQKGIQTTINQLNVEENKNDIEVAIVQTYMQVMYALEAIKINENTVEVSKSQRDRAEELYKAGSISSVDLAKLESQYSTDTYQLIVAQKTWENYKLQLKQLLELEISDEMSFKSPHLSADEVMNPLADKETIYATSLSVMPQIKSSALAIDVAELEMKKAKGGYLPSLSMNAGVGTGHLSGTNYTFGSQVWNKFNESIGLTLTIPIFSNRENKTAVNKAKLSLINYQLDHLNEQKGLLKTVEGIYLDATSSQNQYIAAAQRLKYVEESYRLTEEQFFLGMKNTLELLTEKNNLLNARQEELQSKYMAIMSIQLLQIYQQKPIDINF